MILERFCLIFGNKEEHNQDIDPLCRHFPPDCHYNTDWVPLPFVVHQDSNLHWVMRRMCILNIPQKLWKRDNLLCMLWWMQEVEERKSMVGLTLWPNELEDELELLIQNCGLIRNQWCLSLLKKMFHRRLNFIAWILGLFFSVIILGPM